MSRDSNVDYVHDVIFESVFYFIIPKAMMFCESTALIFIIFYWPNKQFLVLVPKDNKNAKMQTWKTYPFWSYPERRAQHKDVYRRTIEILQSANIFKANGCSKIHNAPLKLASPVSG